ncbi:hypothetical protein AN7090.2 [Aspergillus nidulans FGSC A4]|uniref:Nonribosomal peptide synthase GliP-like, putative (AFU_orthologue AFUA_3G12920) n=1 Tax=Emericella nidulans (strain FGSC A4 / ATCC 38163 / CBS 112.46 / NRRL 194 / M139) TaxID=227321 RepID=Q5AX90_EMENI|nr:hypothetical protein [Aspergillus nidulans FGSC A4]EAA61295.1 hypothetical protein AN7090.2 [Aspergillus nidulans FGSC A4]CBF79105.1 TPA: nonribosomal peptide synthase GliP-like, putative (AFU_orthologue; AFUA_3G12920) [Aspergillus nidulans FGSC A4]|eukprot:XP_664694.1 hypothetical protein AN7090.2 [Aspergillus nidulans FGSC A4]
MIVGEKAQNAVQALESLKSRFEIKEAPEFKRYLGMNIKTTPTGIHLSQEDQIDDIINSFGLHDAHPTKSPLDPGTVIDDAPDLKINIKEYQRANIEPPKAFSDSDWGGPHTKARRSVGGYVFKLAGGPIAWQSKRQTCVATSSNEAEYIAASEASREAYWIREIMKDLRLFDDQHAPGIPLHMDNKGAIDLTMSDIQTKRSKHIDIRYHYTRDMVDQGIIHIKQIPTAEMVADGCTKPLGSEAHSHFIRLLGLRNDD